MNLLKSAGITVNGDAPHDIQVHHPEFYSRVLADGMLGLGESYMDGWWDCPRIDAFITKVLLAKLDTKVRKNWRLALLSIQARLFNLQRLSRAFQVGRRHYDLGNTLYAAMLDKRMNYTCAYWKNARTLDEAQEAKLDLVCRKIGLKPGMKVLDLGCGWGGFAKYAAEKYGASVVGVTVSREQVELGRKLCRGLDVELRLQDYRTVTGTFHRVISIGIMEHVGYKNYREYMRVTDRCLAGDGIAFIHTIGANASSRHASLWVHRYIFPNGMIPSLRQLTGAMENMFVLEDLHNIGPHYDKTLMCWWENFDRAWHRLKSEYDPRFYRMWKFYLLSCAGGFRARHLQLWQMVLTRPGQPQPDCRLS